MGWQLIIVSAALTLPFGITQGKEYAELAWPIDIAIAVVWVVFAVNFFWLLARRRERHLYVAIWFYIATIITITVLHVVNSLAIPVGALWSYSIFGGVQDALVQWWYGHNAVAFFLTTPVLGIMYYFLPKAAERPVFSYRLSIIHFWGLVFIYIWAGPHHLLYTALPDWAQTLGMLFSLMLWAPSWGGMLNGLLTLRGAWDKLRSDPVLKFFAAGVTFYGMATFEGPLLSIKSVNGLAHYTDWIIGHAHSGALGWNGFMAAGMFYWLIPRMYRTKLHSTPAANMHFYIGTLGIVLYVISMWVSGITQGLMWRANNDAGGLMYPNFLETVLALQPMYWTRLVGGVLYLAGFVLGGWNLWMTIKSGAPADDQVEVPVETPRPDGEPRWAEVLFGRPVILCILVGVLAGSIAWLSEVASTFMIVFAFAVALLGVIILQLTRPTGKAPWHAVLEGRAWIFTALVVIAVLVGGVAELIPSLVTGRQALQTTDQAPYSSLEIEGRDVYLSEGCYTCHSQMIRPFAWESARYGAVSRPDDSIFDHPFQWGSKRTGPDLARVGGKYSHLWHYKHMLDPREVSPGSNMPAYPHLATTPVDFADTPGKLRAMRMTGVPYAAAEIEGASATARAAGERVAAELEKDGQVEVAPDSQLVALIAYLQRLGKKTPAVVPAEADAGAGTRVSMRTPRGSEGAR